MGYGNKQRNVQSRTATVNPYTFVPLQRRSLAFAGKKCIAQERLSGVIECTLSTKTQLCIPDAPDAQGRYPFFRAMGQIRIPGSSLRGVIRSAYETYTDSCLKMKDERFHARSKYKMPGLLEFVDGGYVLYPAKRYRATDYKGQGPKAPFSVGERVSFRPMNSSGGTGKAVDLRANPQGVGVFHKVNSFGDKSSPSVFEKKIGAKPLPVDELYIACFKENIELYDLETTATSASDGKGSQKRSGRDYCAAFDRMKRGELLLPVWYLEEDGVFEFAPSQVSRSVYSKSPVDFAAELGLEPCQEKDRCCPACSLFGFVGKEAKASRVRFSDGIASNEQMETQFVTLPALMGPKTSALEFYLARREGDSFSFVPSDDGVTLSGRKMYWHHPNGFKAQPVGNTRSDFLRTVELVPSGETFAFEVFFDDVSEDELNNLVFALTLGDYWEEDEKKRIHFHKFGHGKPLGLGSCDVSVKRVVLRKRTENSYSLSGDLAWKQGRKEIASRLSNVEVMDKVTAFDIVASDKTIAYPTKLNKGEGQIFTWFAKNRETFDKDEGSIKFNEILARDGKPGYLSRFELGSKKNIRVFGEEKKKSEYGNAVKGNQLDALAALRAQLAAQEEGR